MKVDFKSYTFWVALTGAVLILMERLGSAFDFSLSGEVFEGIIFAICGVLVVLGVLNKNDHNDENNADSDDNFVDIDENDVDKNDENDTDGDNNYVDNADNNEENKLNN